MIDGVVREPSEFSMTLGLPPSMIATQEFVVPRSIPMIFAMAVSLQCALRVLWECGANSLKLQASLPRGPGVLRAPARSLARGVARARPALTRRPPWAL